MPINYIDPTGYDAQWNSGAFMNQLFGEQPIFGNEAATGKGLAAQQRDSLRSGLDIFDDRQQAYTIQEIVNGVTGGRQNTTNAIISNFITTDGSPFNVRDHFFNVLESWETSLPLNSMWLVFFKVPDIVRDEVMGAWGEHIVSLQSRASSKGGGMEQDGGINLARRKFVDDDKFTKTLGCAFAQTIQIPQEQVNTDPVGIPNSRGFLPSPVVTQRQRFASINIEFLETNISFVDFLLRPWTVLGSHFGSIARKNTPITTDLIVINMARAGTEAAIEKVNAPGGERSGHQDMTIQNSRGFIPRKIWFFSGCQPINIPSQRHSYNADSEVERRNVEWMFRRYQIYLPTQFEGLFTDIHAKDSLPVHNKIETIRNWYDTVNNENASKRQNDNWTLRVDGEPDPLDNPDIAEHNGDGTSPDWQKYISRADQTQNNANAKAYWGETGPAEDVVPGESNWSVNGAGVPSLAPGTSEPRPAETGEGWGNSDQGETRLYWKDPKGKSRVEAVSKDVFNSRVDGEEDPFDNPDIRAHKGDGTSPNEANYANRVYDPEVGKSAAEKYWGVEGNEASDIIGGKNPWTVSTGGIPMTSSSPVREPRPAVQHSGWDKEPGGSTRKHEPGRKYGYKEGTLEAGKEITKKYAKGDADWNPYTSNELDPAKATMGGSWGPGGGKRYERGLVRPYGLKGVKGAPDASHSYPGVGTSSGAPVTPTQKWHDITYDYGAGKQPTVHPSPMGGFYGPDKGPRYQLHSVKGAIRPTARGASAYTGKTDLLSIILGR